MVLLSNLTFVLLNYIIYMWKILNQNSQQVKGTDNAKHSYNRSG